MTPIITYVTLLTISMFSFFIQFLNLFMLPFFLRWILCHLWCYCSTVQSAAILSSFSISQARKMTKTKFKSLTDRRLEIFALTSVNWLCPTPTLLLVHQSTYEDGNSLRKWFYFLFASSDFLLQHCDRYCDWYSSQNRTVQYVGWHGNFPCSGPSKNPNNSRRCYDDASPFHASL
jgi:hypothetical protein